MPLKTVAARVRKEIAVRRCPRFKDWNEICALGEEGNHTAMMKIALTDLTAPRVMTLVLVGAYPQCFGDWEDVGAVPLSVIRRLGEMAARKQGKSDGADLPVFYGAVPLHVHIKTFDNTRECADSGEPLPYHIARDTPQGDLVNWEFREYRVIENNPHNGTLSITPINAVRIDL